MTLSPVTGKHLIADLYQVPVNKFTDAKLVEEFLLQTSVRVGATIVEDPHLVSLPNLQDSFPAGITGFLLLGESHISIHTWPEHAYVSLDVYSCTEFDSDSLTSYVHEYWEPKGKASITVIKRG